MKIKKKDFLSGFLMFISSLLLWMFLIFGFDWAKEAHDEAYEKMNKEAYDAAQRETLNGMLIERK